MILLQIAERAIFNLKEMETDDLKLHIPKLIEEANLYWTRQEQATAKHLMKSLMNKLEKVDIDTKYLSTEKNNLFSYLQTCSLVALTMADYCFFMKFASH